jgi:hypothetical protein
MSPQRVNAEPAPTARAPVALTPEIKDFLAREGVEVIDNWLGELYRYDLEAHKRVPRKDTPFGAYRRWDWSEPDDQRQPGSRPDCTLDKPYINRLGGFVRETLFGPDEIGQLLRDHNIRYTDAPGNGLLESMMICRKYGLQLHFECPVYSLPDPYTQAELDAYRETYRRECRYMAGWLRRLETLYGQRFLRQDGQLWVVREKYAPLELFVRSYERNAEAVNAEFRAEHGADLPLHAPPQTPKEKALRVRFWRWIRRKHAELLRIQADVFREEVAGEGGVFVSNIHLCPHPDWRRWGEIFDMPGVAARPALLDDERAWKYYAGYVTRLVADLTQKTPLISLRYNLFAAGARVIAGPSAIRYWFSECIRNGVTGFYHWIKDYSSSSDRTGYTGACLGNPDESTLPRERWRTFLDVCKQVGETKVFVPPRADVGVLVSLDSLALGGWQRVLDAHIALRQAAVWHNFVSDDLVEQGRVRLDDFKVLIVPVAPFERISVVNAVATFVKAGGTLVIGDPTAFSYDLEGESIDAARCELWGEGQTASPRRVGRGAVHLLGAEGLQPGDGGDQGEMLKRIAADAGARDQSWIWRVNLDNLQQVTGQQMTPAAPIDEQIQFRSYMYEHSCLHIVPWLTEGQWSGGEDNDKGSSP